jgi:hypothetical protein
MSIDLTRDQVRALGKIANKTGNEDALVTVDSLDNLDGGLIVVTVEAAFIGDEGEDIIYVIDRAGKQGRIS